MGGEESSINVSREELIPDFYSIPWTLYIILAGYFNELTNIYKLINYRPKLNIYNMRI